MGSALLPGESSVWSAQIKEMSRGDGAVREMWQWIRGLVRFVTVLGNEGMPIVDQGRRAPEFLMYPLGVVLASRRGVYYVLSSAVNASQHPPISTCRLVRRFLSRAAHSPSGNHAGETNSGASNAYT